MLSAVYFLSFIFFRFEREEGLGRQDFYLTQQASFLFISVPYMGNLVKENNMLFSAKRKMIIKEI